DRDGEIEIYVMERDGRHQTRETIAGGGNEADWGTALATQSNIVRTLVYNQITSVVLNDAHHFKLSASGNRAVYVNYTYGPSARHLYAVDADGAGSPREVISFPDGNNFGGADISSDGSRILTRDAWAIYGVNADGSNLHTLIRLADFSLGETHLSGDGNTVVF